MEDSGFIVPPPGLIPPRPAPDAPGDREPAAVRAAPSFSPPASAPPGSTPSAAPSFVSPLPAPPTAAPRPVWRLILTADRSLPVTGTVVLGRNPTRPEHAPEAELIALDDPTSTVSKTHAALEPMGDGLTVTDLHSTNGVAVDGVPAPPGVPVPVADGSELLLGDLRVHVRRS